MIKWLLPIAAFALIVSNALSAGPFEEFTATTPKETPKIVMTYSSEKRVEFIDEHGHRLNTGLLCIYAMPGTDEKYNWQLPYVRERCPKYITIIPSD
jgi:hypothetical protein